MAVLSTGQDFLEKAMMIAAPRMTEFGYFVAESLNNREQTHTV
jgi:hypothetical protein